MVLDFLGKSNKFLIRVNFCDSVHRNCVVKTSVRRMEMIPWWSSVSGVRWRASFYLRCLFRQRICASYAEVMCHLNNQTMLRNFACAIRYLERLATRPVQSAKAWLISAQNHSRCTFVSIVRLHRLTSAVRSCWTESNGSKLLCSLLLVGCWIA